MRSPAFGPALALSVSLSLVHLSSQSPPPAGTAGTARAFVGATILDGTPSTTIKDGVLLVRDGRVAAIGSKGFVPLPSGVETIDVSGKTIIPGLVNAHGHVGDTSGLVADPKFYTEQNVLRQTRLYARYGVTTVMSLGGDGPVGFNIRDAQKRAGSDHARLFVAGDVIAAETPDAARKAVDAAADQQVDFIKIRVDDNLGTGRKMSPEVYQAVIERAHQRGKRVLAHIFYLDDAKLLLKAGIDFLAHSIRDRDVDAELIALMKARDICLSPTLMREVSAFVYESRPAFFDDPFFLRESDAEVVRQLEDPKRQAGVKASRSAQGYKAALVVASRNVKALSDAGIRIASGTDTGPPARFQGYFEHLELERLVEAGLTPMQALVAATRDAAACFNAGDQLGTLRPGRAADFLVLARSPLDDIRNTRSIESVWIGGNRVPARSGN